MINQVYQLVSPRRFEVAYKDWSLQCGDVVVRPTHLSICAADQRYYTGSRGKKAMAKKLPMAIIHEGVGKVVYDPKGEFAIGSKVVMIPNSPTKQDDVIAENYLRSSKFRASGFDGFMQDYMFLNRDRIVPLSKGMNLNVAAFTELISVSVHAISRFKGKAHSRKDVLGVWGDGNLGFITALLLKKMFPESEIHVFGKHDYKLDHFSFADQVYLIDEIPKDEQIDHAFECVGGIGSQYAIEQMIDVLNPEGTMALMGVSEHFVEVNTRMVLEKGITLIGSSRSGRADFEDTIELFKTYPELASYMETLVGSVNDVRSIRDVLDVFEKDLTTSWGKTVMEWGI